jgi:hypothetical protein
MQFAAKGDSMLADAGGRQDWNTRAALSLDWAYHLGSPRIPECGNASHSKAA